MYLRGVENGNALAGQTVCFVEINNTRSVNMPEDCLTFALIRWLEPHPDAWERDAQHRPVCDGPLHVNNCLWRYAQTDIPRRALVARDGSDSIGFRQHKRLFGRTENAQRLCWEREKYAYYGLVTLDSVIEIMHMCNTFEPNSSVPVYDTWLQTVHLC